jgi:hypothetical protein
LKCMFANPTYLQFDDGASDDEDYNQDLVEWSWHCWHWGLTAMDEDNCFDNVDVLEASWAPMDRALARLHETMVEITTKCTYGCKCWIVWPCNITYSRSWIKHSPPSFGSNQQIHAFGNGISLGGWWLRELHQSDEGLAQNNDGALRYS